MMILIISDNAIVPGFYYMGCWISKYNLSLFTCSVGISSTDSGINNSKENYFNTIYEELEFV